MIATLKADVINRYKQARKLEVPFTDAERKAFRKKHPKAKEEEFFRVELQPYFYAKTGDKVTIITESPGAWNIAVVVENKSGDRFSVLWENLNTHK